MKVFRSADVLALLRDRGVIWRLVLLVHLGRGCMGEEDPERKTLSEEGFKECNVEL